MRNLVVQNFPRTHEQKYGFLHLQSNKKSNLCMVCNGLFSSHVIAQNTCFTTYYGSP